MRHWERVVNWLDANLYARELHLHGSGVDEARVQAMRDHLQTIRDCSDREALQYLMDELSIKGMKWLIRIAEAQDEIEKAAEKKAAEEKTEPDAQIELFNDEPTIRPRRKK